MNKKHLLTALKIVLTLVISIASLMFAMNKIDWQEIIKAIQSMAIPYLILAALISTGNVLIRALRWHLLLKDEGSQTLTQTAQAVWIGYLGNNILPGRAGEFLRSIFLALAGNIRKTLVLATAFIERLIDAATLLMLALIMLNFTEALPSHVQSTLNLIIPILSGAIIFIFLTPRFEKLFSRLILKLPVGKNISDKLNHFFLGIVDGIRTFHNVRRLGVFIFLTVIVWIFDAFAIMLFLQAFTAPISLPQAIVFLTAIGFASSIPATPGYVGVFQAIAVMLLPIFGVSANIAFAMISVFQAQMLVLSLVFGVYSWISLRKSLNRAQLEKELNADR